MDLSEAALASKFEVVLPHLDERQRRLLLGAEARMLGHGGIRLVAKAAGVGENMVSRGVSEVDSGVAPLGRVRRPGGGRKRLAQTDPGVVTALLALVEPDVRGDPMSPLRWTTKSTRRLADELTRQGHRVGADTVADLLRAQGFSLQGNAKTVEGKQHPDRDAQFRYINETARTRQQAGQPVISVDAKKKELVGLFANGGREWEPKGSPVPVSVHDFEDKLLGKAVPYGIYDLAANSGWVNVGTDGDTAVFAVESIRRWWNTTGGSSYPQATQLLIIADAGGSNGYRTRAWKAELATLAAQTGLAITVCHLPQGTSKWNKIEHRLFSAITQNWRGRPLTSHEVIVETIAATTTRTGLKVHAQLDTGAYPTGVKVSDAAMEALPIVRHGFHGDWNYTLHSQPLDIGPTSEPVAARFDVVHLRSGARAGPISVADLLTAGPEGGRAYFVMRPGRVSLGHARMRQYVFAMPELVYPPVVALAKTLFRMLDLRVSVVGGEHVPRAGGAALACNHISYLDFIFAGFGAQPSGRLVRFMAKQEVFSSRIAGPLMRAMHHIPVDREAGLASYKAALAALKDGEVVGVFPEATISQSFTVKELKSGAARMAAAAGVPLVPMALWGTQRLWTKGRPRRLLQRHLPISVLIGEPLTVSRRDDATGLLRRRMSELLDRAQREYPVRPSGPDDDWWLPAHLGGGAPVATAP